MPTYELLVGSDNETHKLDPQFIVDVLNEMQVSSFTLLPGVGYWQGQREDTCSITLSGTENRVWSIIRTLARKLHQDAIAYHQVPDLQYYYNEDQL